MWNAAPPLGGATLPAPTVRPASTSPMDAAAAELTAAWWTRWTWALRAARATPITLGAAPRRSYAEEIQAQGRRRKMIFFGAVALLVVVVAAVAGTAAFFAWSDSQLSLGDSNAKEALAAPEEGAPYYALLSADLAKNTAAPSASDEAYLAVRIDEGARTLTFISLPPSVSVELSDGERHALRDAASVGGDAELLRPPVRCSGFSSPTSRPPMPRASPPWSIWWGACPWSCPRRWTTPGPVSMC